MFKDCKTGGFKEVIRQKSFVRSLFLLRISKVMTDSVDHSKTQFLSQRGIALLGVVTTIENWYYKLFNIFSSPYRKKNLLNEEQAFFGL
jgi:hypothetical protein